MLLLTVAATAQGVQKGSTLRLRPQHAIKAADSQMWWGYYMDDANLSGFGTQEAETYEAAIGIPSSLTFAQGLQIKALRFIVGGTQAMKDFSVWISEALPPASASNYQRFALDMSQVKDGTYTEFELPQPYTITSKGVYVGISFTITNTNSEGARYPLLVTNDGTNIPQALLVRTSGRLTEWRDFADSESGYGKLAMQVLLEGDFMENAVSLGSFRDVFSLISSSGDAELELFNHGTNEVNNIDYAVTDGNGNTKDYHLDLPACKPYGAATTINLPVEGDAVAGRTARTIKVTKVNGQPNAITGATAETSGYMVTLSQFSPKRTLVEEFTGTWCGWCPRGITGLDMLNEQMADEVVTVAIHSDDPMAISYGVEAPSYPYAMVNRSIAADPYMGKTQAPFGIGDLVAKCNKTPAEASVELGDLELASNGRINVTTNVVFRYNSDKAPYALAYVLLADSLTGDARNWWQHNYYTGRQEYAYDENLKYWVDEKEYVHMPFHHVAIASKSVANGITNSIKAPIVDGAAQKHTTTFTLTGNALAQNLDKLSVVAMLINTETGTVVNATVKPVALADNFPCNSASVNDFAQTVVVLGDTAEVEMPITSLGKNPITSIDYTIRTGRVESDTIHMELPEPISTYGLRTTIQVKVPSDTITGIITRYITIRGINGETNEAGTARSTGKILTIAQKSPKRTVFEEFTGTWCIWCPRGLVSMDHVTERYPNDAVVIAIHGGDDPMALSAFNGLTSGMSMPTLWVNRYIKPDNNNKPDVYTGYRDSGWGIGDIIEQEQKKLAEAAIELSTPVLDEETGDISFSTDVTFQFNRRSAPYTLAYALLADGLTGTTSAWNQANIFSLYAGSYDDDPEMKYWTEQGTSVPGYIYNHVAIAHIGLTASPGITGSLTSKAELGVTQSHASKFNIKNSSLAKIAKKLHVVALLYDKERGAWVNADIKDVISGTEGVSTLPASDDIREVARYTIDGKRISQPQKGINIVKMSDGKVHKIVVR